MKFVVFDHPMLNMKVEFYRGPKITVVKVHTLVLTEYGPVTWLWKHS